MPWVGPLGSAASGPFRRAEAVPSRHEGLAPDCLTPAHLVGWAGAWPQASGLPSRVSVASLGHSCR